MNDNLVVVRGAGDIATGVIYVLRKFSYKVLALEIENPSVIRRTVAFAEAMYSGECELEGMKAKRCSTLEEAVKTLETEYIPILCDKNGDCIKTLKPKVVVDAILAKRNCGTTIDMADYVIGVGPGFTAKKDCHAVIETNRGHYLGRVILDGQAEPNTGVPGNIGGFTKERVIKSPVEGYIKNISKIADQVKKGQVIAKIGDTNVYASIDGVLRGLIHDNYYVPANFKIADIDPRDCVNHCFSITEKARLIGFGVLQAIRELEYKR